jgi:Zn-dependent peptidase ImmA (M78 family)
MGAKHLAYINSELLKWARLETPFRSHEDVVERIKSITVDELQKWEEGEDFPSVTEAKQLSKLYDIPFAALYLPEVPPKREKIYTDRRTVAGSIPRQMSYELWKEIRYLLSCRENALELIDENEEITDLPSISNRTSVDNVAKIVREHFNIMTPYKNKSTFNGNSFNFFRHILESKGIMILQLSDVSMHEVRGISLCFDNLPIIAVNKADSNNGKTFTLFHELAHIIRRTSALCMINFNVRDEEEEICDKIAAEILMPYKIFVNMDLIRTHSDELWSDYEIDNISEKYGVSKFVAIRRLFEIGKINEDYYWVLYNEYIDEFERIKEQKEKTSENKEFKLPYYIKYLSATGKLYPSIVLSAYSEGKVSIGETCRILNINIKHINKIEQAVMFK